MKQTFCWLVYFCGFFLHASYAQLPNTRSDFKIIGYYPLQGALTDDLTSFPFTKLTHINLWFLNPDSLGNFTKDLSALAPFVQAAHTNHVKVLFSIGGGRKQAQYHRLLQADKRPVLIKNLVEQVLQYNLDGIDVDLEGSDIDENYERFVGELATSLKSHQKLLTAAIAVYYKDQLSDKALAAYDFVNIMAYDRTGPWRPEKPGPHSTYEHAQEDLAYFAKVRSIPIEKMTLGVPFYGYGYGPALNSPAISMSYKDIIAAFPGAQSVDQWTMPDGKILYYNGKPTIQKKTLLAKEKASGIMIWQLMGDTTGTHSLLETIYKAAHNKTSRSHSQKK